MSWVMKKDGDGIMWYRFCLSNDDSCKKESIWMLFCTWLAGIWFSKRGIYSDAIHIDKWGFKIKAGGKMNPAIAGEFDNLYSCSFGHLSEIPENEGEIFGNDEKWFLDFVNKIYDESNEHRTSNFIKK